MSRWKNKRSDTNFKFSPKTSWATSWEVADRRNKILVAGPTTAGGVDKSPREKLRQLDTAVIVHLAGQSDDRTTTYRFTFSPRLCAVCVEKVL